jgi:hypothetical protein
VLEVDDRQSLKELSEDVPASSRAFFLKGSDGQAVTPAVDHERRVAALGRPT